MAHPEPSTPPADNPAASDPSWPSRHSRIHFPKDDSSPARRESSAPDHRRGTSLSFRSSPARRTSPLNPQNALSSVNARRRVRSVDASSVFVDSPRSRRVPANPLASPSRMSPSLARETEDHLMGLFSDEYDLSREDPRILQDVQRALKLKARREARLKAGQAASPTRKSSISISEITSTLSTSNSSSPTRPLFSNVPSSPTAPAKESTSNTSEVDFGPSTVIPGPTAHLHPVPSSSDDGMTLDWTGSGIGDERRWSLSIPKRKGKEKAPPLHMATERQEKLHADRIGRIKTVATPHTLRKAAITKEQLARRYNLIYGPSSLGPARLNIAKVARWYGSQETVVRASLEKAEPFTWLKHLNKRSTKPASQSPWHLSALIMEEYIHAQSRSDPMRSIPEHSPLAESSPETTFSQPLNGLYPIPSRTSSHYSLGPSLSRKLSFEGRVSFEPLVDSARNSLEMVSRKSGDSAFSSDLSRSPNPFGIAGAVSLASSPVRVRDSTLRPRRTLTRENEDPSSGYNSYLDRSDDGANKAQGPCPSDDSRPTNSAAREVFNPSRDPSDEEVAHLLCTPAPTASTPPARLERGLTQLTIDKSTDGHAGRRRPQISLPSGSQVSRLKQRRRLDADEEKVDRDYERKAQLLAQTTAQNHRIRQLLNRVSTGVREYDLAQSNAMKSLQIPHNSLPRELLDAFGHDPAAVTGATRRFRGWRAVDDIYNRVIRQREVFGVFLSQASGNPLDPSNVLDDPVAALVGSLERLEDHKEKIATKAREVADLLASVQTTHAGVKRDYNNTLSHTSVVYPELSHIVALEESYKDQYQQFWEFGMDALTFLLDTVTPFWRTYGKTIGEDVRDFLIIPLYRNEFTGEAKRYPITGFPRRSCRHWIGLAFFFVISVGVNILQVRAAVSSSVHFKLRWVPYEGIRWAVLPFFWIGIIIQWWAVLAECAVVLLQLAVLTWWTAWAVKIFA